MTTSDERQSGIFRSLPGMAVNFILVAWWEPCSCECDFPSAWTGNIYTIRYFQSVSEGYQVHLKQPWSALSRTTPVLVVWFDTGIDRACCYFAIAYQQEHCHMLLNEDHITVQQCTIYWNDQLQSSHDVIVKLLCYLLDFLVDTASLPDSTACITLIQKESTLYSI